MRTLALFAANAALALSAGGTLQASAAQTAASALSARGALAQARGEGARARERAAVLDRQARAATLASERATLAAAALGARVEQAEAALAGADADWALLRDRRRALDRRLARERAPVARLVAGLQSQVRRPALLTLLQPGSIRDAVHFRAAVAAVGPQIAARTSGLRSALERSRGLEQEAARIAAHRRALRADLVDRRTALAAMSAAEVLKARRAAGAADREGERALALGEQARDLSTLLRRIGTTSPRSRNLVAPRAGPSAGAPSPYRLPVAGRVEPADAGSRAVSLIARPGALVVAPAAGRVAFAGPFRGYGAIVIVEHANGWTSLVTGLGTVKLAIGQTLVAGSPLGAAPLANPRIGLELRRGSEQVNPLDQMSDRPPR